MNQQDLDILRKHRVMLVETIDATKLTDYLYQKGILVAEDIEIIKNKVTRADRARTLVDIIPTRGPTAFGIFVDALRQEYDWLVETLTRASATI